MAGFWWIGWLYAVGFALSAAGLATTVMHYRAEGSPLLKAAFLAWAFLGFGMGVFLWLRPFRHQPRIVPYFARRLEEYGGPTSAAFAGGRSLFLELAALDALAERLGVAPLSAFGFPDDHYGQEVRWHPASEGCQSADALRQNLAGLGAAPELASDLDALSAVLHAAADREVAFALVLRLHAKDSLQGVMTREDRQGSFW
jgi:hypothetical protein